MGASSVTGVSGAGTGINRGPGNNRNQFFPMVDPHVVWHGTVPVVNNVAVVTLPSTITLPPERLTILVAGKGWSVEKTVGLDGNVTGFVILSGAEFIDFVVIDAVGNCFCETFGEQDFGEQ